MNRSQIGDLEVFDIELLGEDLRDEVLGGLARSPKRLPTKLLYDEAGSRLFDRICELDEYYLTRAELAIMRQHAGAMAAALGAGSRLVELGSGSSVKTRFLLDRMPDLAAYVPIDISRDHLVDTACALAESYPALSIQPVCADYTAAVRLPEPARGARTVVYFPGSTIGNFTADAARAFLRRVGALCGRRGGLLVGVDLVKDEGVLHRAYNDRSGVTAAFNLNLLRHLNRELDGTFAVDRFRHRAFWDDAPARIEMQLVSKVAQNVRVAGRDFELAAGEPITTEYSHKFTLEGFAELVGSAGFAVLEVWTDPARLFSVQYCERE